MGKDSPEVLREFATPRDSSGPNWQDAWASPCSSVRFTTLVKFFVESFLKDSGAWLQGNSRFDPLEDEEIDRFVVFLVNISMAFFGEETEIAIWGGNLPESDSSDGTVAIDKV